MKCWQSGGYNDTTLSHSGHWLLAPSPKDGEDRGSLARRQHYQTRVRGGLS